MTLRAIGNSAIAASLGANQSPRGGAHQAAGLPGIGGGLGVPAEVVLRGLRRVEPEEPIDQFTNIVHLSDEAVEQLAAPSRLFDLGRGDARSQATSLLRRLPRQARSKVLAGDSSAAVGLRPEELAELNNLIDEKYEQRDLGSPAEVDAEIERLQRRAAAMITERAERRLAPLRRRLDEVERGAMELLRGRSADPSTRD